MLTHGDIPQLHKIPLNHPVTVDLDQLGTQHRVRLVRARKCGFSERPLLIIVRSRQRIKPGTVNDETTTARSPALYLNLITRDAQNQPLAQCSVRKYFPGNTVPDAM